MKKDVHNIRFVVVTSIFVVMTLFSLVSAPVVAIANCLNTSQTPIPICSCIDLNNTNDDLTGFYRVQNDINCSNSSTWGTTGFDPIGASVGKFTGTFDGGGFNISYIHINSSNSDDIGMFGWIGSGTVANVTLSHCNITGNNNVGCLAGRNSGTIQSCSASGNVTSTGDYGGGLVGRGSNINFSWADVRVDVVDDYAGGLTGGIDGGVINYSWAMGHVTGDDRVGGLVGSASSHIDKSNASGYVVGRANTGGLAGLSSNVFNSFATGNVTGSGSDVGGLIGITQFDIIINTSASGNVSNSGGATGGLVGYTDSNKFNRSYATGKVFGANDVGGLIGIMGSSSTVDRCYATGNISATSTEAGGLIGDSNSGNIFNSFARGEVFSTSTDVGGFIGDSSSTRINYSYSTGLVHGTAQVGGFIGDGTAGDKIENSFWDNQTSNQTVSEGGQGKLTAEMQNAENFTDIDNVAGLTLAWDFKDNPRNDTANKNWWVIDPSLNDNYPFLAGIGVGFGTDAQPPIVDITFPINGTHYILNITELNYTVTDDGTLDVCWYSNNTGVKNSTTVAAGTDFTGQVNIVNGVNNWTVYCNDTSNNVGNDLVIFTNDIQAPAYTGIANATIELGDSFIMDINATDNIELGSFTVNDTANFSINSSGFLQNTTQLTVGEHYLNISVNDTAGNTNSSLMFVNVSDTITPNISIDAPSNNSNSSLTGLNISYTVIDLNTISTCWYSNDTSKANGSLGGCANISNVTWPEGQFNITIYVNDTSNNINSSNVKFTIDTTNPGISIDSPANQTNTSKTGLNISYTVAEPNTVSTCWYSNDTSKANGSLGGCANISNVTWPEGQFNITIYVNDTSNNINSSAVTFTVDTTAATVTSVSPTHFSGDNDGNMSFIYNVTDTHGILNCSLIINNKVNLTDTQITKNINQNFTINNTSTGQYNWSVNCTDDAANIGATSIRRVFVIPASRFLGNTTDLSGVNVSNISKFVVDRPSWGRINYTVNLNLTGSININDYINITSNRIEINSSAVPALNASARLALYNLSFVNPRILVDGTVCPISRCNKLSYEDNTLIFNVTHFSSYSAGETPSAESGSSAGGGSGGGSGRFATCGNGACGVLEFCAPDKFTNKDIGGCYKDCGLCPPPPVKDPPPPQVVEEPKIPVMPFPNKKQQGDTGRENIVGYAYKSDLNAEPDLDDGWGILVTAIILMACVYLYRKSKGRHKYHRYH